jgi:hypothetical protein
MKISLEAATRELGEELIPLGQASWDECSEIKKDTCAYHGQRNLPIDPDIDRYLNLAASGSLIVMTLRSNEGVLTGLASVILYNSLHLKNELCGNIDVFYVLPEYRKYMPRFMTSIEKELFSRGINIIAWPVTATGKLREILKKRGYVADDVVMELKLKNTSERLSCA